jgi:predicted nucleic acid-binding protein
MKAPSKVFLDTNILVYAADGSDPKKQKKAQAVVKQIRQDGNGVISTQVMQEFFAVALRKLKLVPLDAKKLTMTLNDFEVLPMTPELVEQGMDLTILHQFSFWDALIVAAAKEGRCSKVLTEDFQAGRRISGVTIENPL